MRKIENNEWLILNNIIYKIYSNENFNDMRRELLEQLKMIIDFDCADFHLSKGDGSRKMIDPITYHMNVNNSIIYEDLDYSRGLLNGKSRVYRESDIMIDEMRVKTEYYTKVYRNNNVHYSLQMIICHQDIFQGVITLYKKIGKSDFTYGDIFIVDMLKDHLAFRLYSERSKKDKSKMSVSEASRKFELTKREVDVLQLVLQGISNTEISDRLIITNNTLKKHILNIYKKININNRIQLFKLIDTSDLS